uniref:Plexin C1 n=1 Tax=Junco hyemalis TaxID=40217 RepID=A0A8C5J6I1_JUNHY
MAVSHRTEPAPMAAPPPALSWALPLLAALAGAAGPQSFELPGAPIDNIEVSGGAVLVAGGSCLYELRPELRPRRRVVPAAGQGCGEPPGMRSNLLLHYEEAGGVGVLLTGWTQDGGACQVWEQPSYRQRLNQSEVVSCLPDGSTAGVVFQQAGAWYLAVAATYSTSADTNHLHCEPSKSDKETVITVRSMVNLKSKEELGIIKRREEPLHFVDALQWGDHLFFPYYTLKARLANNTEPPSMAVLRQLGPSDGGLTLQGHVYLDCGCRSLIISSSLVRQGERGWWVGVFRHSHNAKAWNSTAVCIFGMEEMKERACVSWAFPSTIPACPETSSLVLSFDNMGIIQLHMGIHKETSPEGLCLVAVRFLMVTFKFPVYGGCINSMCYCILWFQVRRIPVANCGRFASEQECLSAKDPYCGWCSFNQRYFLHISIQSIEPLWISTLGKSEITVKGENFTRASGIKLILTGITGCKPDVIKVRNVLNDTQMTFALPPTRKEAKSICIQANGKKCSPPMTLHYVSLPSCSRITPNTSWISGGRKITTTGRNFNVVDSVIISDDQRSNLTVSRCPGNASEYHYLTPSLSHATEGKVVDMMLRVDTTFIPCVKLHYHPDPVFINYQLHTELDPDLELKIYKENDNLNISKTEVEVYLLYMTGAQTKKIWFSVQNITKKPDRSTILCKFKREGTDKIDFSTVKVFVKLGNFEHEVKPTSSHIYLYVLILLPIVVAAFIVTRYKSKELTRKQSQQLELLEYEIRKEIREGFAELQMDELDVVDSFGTVPFLDYKHFALRTFFPESGGFASIFSEEMPQSRDQTSKDESFNMLHALICNKNFLVTLIHTLEKQKNFSVKDRCLFASFLTIALQTKLVYLTHILEVLTRDLMEQSSNVQPKLLLRRTESVVEKLLTNWMSVCLSGFLRETIGEPFYLLVTTLNQRINKGPVDAITCKALYTLNEDWLLWQVSEFKTVTLNIIFEKIPENESGDASQTIQVNVLDCDTIGQAKEKSLQAFFNKNGFLYGLQLDEIGLELVSEEQQRELLDIDGSSEVMDDGIRKLNTIGHYEPSRTHKLVAVCFINGSLLCCLDVDYSDEHCHLILPDSEANKDVKGAGHKGKQKFKVKEMYLTKLLSTKVAIHAVVEKLFRSIWSLPNNKAPVAIKYFFDFLDAQAESKKITDPDVVHIWKTNSLPLRFWVNILKNPQFVFDIKKTSHIDGCLSVIAQAFMDAFSLAEQTLGKEAPTNKLLYAKDIPLYKKEVKAYYKAIRDLPPLTTAEVEEFLAQESKKHENEFNEKVALFEIYKYIVKYYDEIISKLERERGFEEVQKQLQQVKALFDEKKKCKWH